MKNRVKMVKLNLNKVKKQQTKWDCPLIGYVVGKNPSFKQMLASVYTFWKFMTTPRVFLHNDGYFIFRFENEDDREKVLNNGPYTYDYKVFVLKPWIPNFMRSKESLKQVPLWVVLPNLPIKYWAIENRSRIASYLGKSVCTDGLTTGEDRISYARMLIEMDVTQPLPEHLLIEDSMEILGSRTWIRIGGQNTAKIVWL
ncbi:hypothetical protein P3S67_015589 [Capsicum chacoense]